jgi:hypothetical protein
MQIVIRDFYDGDFMTKLVTANFCQSRIFIDKKWILSDTRGLSININSVVVVVMNIQGPMDLNPCIFFRVSACIIQTEQNPHTSMIHTPKQKSRGRRGQNILVVLKR